MAAVELKDLLVVIATLLAPLFAVQVTRWLDRSRQVRDEQMRIFKTLMSTRAASLDPRHVEALNMIDVAFSANTSEQKAIRSAWTAYLDHLNSGNVQSETWAKNRVDLQVDLLHKIAAFLGFDFDKTHIKNQVYFPRGFGNFEDEQAAIRRFMVDLSEGKKSLGVRIENVTANPVLNRKQE
jgi:hypothetical protein